MGTSDDVEHDLASIACASLRSGACGVRARAIQSGVLQVGRAHGKNRGPAVPHSEAVKF